MQFHVTKLDVLKIPLKGLLGGFHVELSDLVHASNIPGVQIVDNDIIFDTQKLLPPPHIHGQLTSVRVSPPEHLRLQITPETCVYKVFFREIEIGEFDLKLCGLGLSRGAMIC